MKINDNNLFSLLKFYKINLNDSYTDNEIMAVFDLVCNYYLGFSKSEVLIKMNERINQSELINLYNTCNLLKTGKPIQYILNQAYFFDLKFNACPSQTRRASIKLGEFVREWSPGPEG